MQIYLSFRHENEGLDGHDPVGETDATSENAGSAQDAAGIGERPPGNGGLPVGSSAHEASGRPLPPYLAPCPTRHR